MTDIKQLAKNLRRYNAWRRGAEGVEMPIPKDLSKWIEEAANALDCLTEPEPIKCETCEGAGKIDERLGGYHTSNANAQCPDCDGAGYLESIHDFRPSQWWVKELDGIQASQEATPDQKRAVAVVHNLLRHILKLERTERTAGAEGAQAEEVLPGNVLAQRVEKLEADRDALAGISKELIERLREAAAQRVASTAMIGADDLIAAADALEIATAGMNAYCDELGSCRKAAGFGSADDPMAQEGVGAFSDPLCVAAFDRYLKGEGE